MIDPSRVCLFIISIGLERIGDERCSDMNNVALVKDGKALYVEVGGIRINGGTEITLTSDVVQIPDCDNPDALPRLEIVGRWLTIRMSLADVDVR